MSSVWNGETHDDWDGDEVEAEQELPNPNQLWLPTDELDEDDAP